MKQKGFLVITFILFTARLAVGQYGTFGLTDARQLAMGNTFAADSREIYAAGKNPSLLAYRNSDRKFDILFPNLSVREYNIVSTTDLINDFFSQKPKDMILGMDGSLLKKAFEGNGKLYLGLQIGFLGAGFTPGKRIGSFSFVMKDYLEGYLQLPKALVDFRRSSSTKSFYLKDFEFSTTWYRSFELSYGKAFDTPGIDGLQTIYAGIGIKYIQGFLYNDIKFSTGIAYEDEHKVLSGSYQASATFAYSNDIDMNNLFNGKPVISHVPFMDPVGQGLGVDAGVTLLLDPGILAAISVTDVGFINWKGKTKHTLVSGIIKIDSTLSLENIDSLSKLVTIKHQNDNQFQSSPASSLHLGFSFLLDRFITHFPGRMGVTLELHSGLTRTAVNPNIARVALGVDWKPGKHWPVFLTGITNSLTNDPIWSLGLGYELSFMEIYITAPNLVPLFKGNSLNAVSVSICWHFLKDKKAGANRD